MSWRGCLLGLVGGLLGLLVGCLPLETWQTWVKSDQGELLAGSPDGVSFQVQATLTRLGMYVQSSREGDNLRIDSCTRSGKKFRLVLSRVEKDGATWTRMCVIWDGEADSAFWLDLLGTIRTGQNRPQEQQVSQPVGGPIPSRPDPKNDRNVSK